MKQFTLLLYIAGIAAHAAAQKYPEPEFSNEVYYLKKDSGTSVVRLEKSISKMESKTKAAGFGGAESGYMIEGERSPVRLPGGSALSFVISSNSTTAAAVPNAQRDSIIRAHGGDPAMIEAMNNMNDPSRTITLYKTDKDKEGRKILLQKTPGMMPFGSKKIKSSDKYSFSVKKIREGYWELVIDKNLPRGEYAFTIMNMTNADAGAGGVTLFAFGVD